MVVASSSSLPPAPNDSLLSHVLPLSSLTHLLIFSRAGAGRRKGKKNAMAEAEHDVEEHARKMATSAGIWAPPPSLLPYMFPVPASPHSL
jgi:hypothetical protein